MFDVVKKHLLNLCLASLLLLGGCAASGPAYDTISGSIPSLSSDNARLYFLRDGGFMNSGLVARVHVNGEEIAGIGMNGFTYFDKKPGELLVQIDAPLNFGEAYQRFKAERGETYYFLIVNDGANVMAGSFGGVIGAANAGGGRFDFYRIPEAMALTKLPEKKFVGSGH